MFKSAAIALAFAAGLGSAGAAVAGDLILFEYSGTANVAWSGGVTLPDGPGRYLIEYSGVANSKVILNGGFDAYTLVYPLPEGAFILADQVPVSFYETISGPSGSYLFEVFEPVLSLSAPLGPGNAYGLPEGTVIATEEFAKDVHFGWYFEHLDFGDAPYAITVTALGVVPEPRTWALITLGFGAAGCTLRRRRGAFA